MFGKPVPGATLLLLLFAVFSAAPALAQAEATGVPGDRITAAMADLPADLLQRARALGYADGDEVELRIAATGALQVLPKAETLLTPEQEDAKALAVMRKSVVRTMTPGLRPHWMLDIDAARVTHYEVRVPFANLQSALQTDALAKGYSTSDTVTVEVDTEAWAPRVPQKAIRFAVDFDELVPGPGPDSPSRAHVIGNFDELPAAMQARAAELGYARGSRVHLLTDLRNTEWAVIPPPFLMGLGMKLEEMRPADREQAAKLGYGAGDVVWRDVLAKGAMVPKDRAQSGPVFEMAGVELVAGRPTPIGVTRFERLKPRYQQEALALGYKAGDKVGAQLGPNTPLRLLKPGVAEMAAEASMPSRQPSPAPASPAPASQEPAPPAAAPPAPAPAPAAAFIPVTQPIMLGALQANASGKSKGDAAMPGKPYVVFTLQFVDGLAKKTRPERVANESLPQLEDLPREGGEPLVYRVQLDSGPAWLAFSGDGTRQLFFSDAWEPRAVALDARKRIGLHAAGDRVTIPCGKTKLDTVVTPETAGAKRVLRLSLDPGQQATWDQLTAAFPEDVRRMGADRFRELARKGILCRP